MARRIGGKYSPPPGEDQQEHRPPAPPTSGGPPPPSKWVGRRPSRVNARVNFLFLLTLPFGLMAFFRPATDMALGLLVFGILLLSVWLTREGLRAEEAYDARRVARRPSIPRKIFGSVLMGVGLGLAGLAHGAGVSETAVFALLGAGLHFGAFGPDPLKDKGIEGVADFQNDRVARSVQEAERHLSDMMQFIRGVGDRRLVTRMESFQANVRAMFRAVENDPRNLTAARRYLGVYLLGARDATQKFAELYARSRDASARADYESLLEDLDRNFTNRTQALLANDRTALDIEMEVLRDRLAREGVRTDEDTA